MTATAPPEGPVEERRRGRSIQIPAVAWPVAVGFLLRLAWALAATPDSFLLYSEPAEYLSYADQLANLQTYRINGRVTAFFPAGWPILMSPVVWVSNHTGWFIPTVGTTVLSAVIGGYTIWISARLARIWLGERPSVMTAWLVAVSPALILVTATPLAEIPYTAIVLTLLVPLSKVLRSSNAQLPGRRPLVAFGLLAGFLILVRSSGLVVLLMAAALLWHWARSPAAWARMVGWSLVGMAVFLVPMTVRNGVQVGFWTPFSTSQAGAVCMGHHDGANGGMVNEHQFLLECHWGAPHKGDRGSYGPWEPGVEARWARQMPREALAWAVSHPGEEVGLSLDKTVLLLGQDRNGGALSFTEYERAIPERFVDPLWRLIEAGRWAFLGLAAVGLGVSRRCRRATVLWLTPLVMGLVVWAGATGGRMNLPLLPFLAMLGSAVLARERGLPAETETGARHETDPATDQDPVSLEGTPAG